MNYKILQKVLDEVSRESPKLDYIRGMVETLLSLKPEEKIEPAVFKTRSASFEGAGTTGTAGVAVSGDEGSMLDAIARANLKTVQDLARKSSE